MLSDEEKEAMEYFNTETRTEEMHYGAILVNLIEKQSKEIEELKDESKEYQIGFAQGCYEKDLDWEDKIKAKIEEYEQDVKDFEEYWSKDPRKFKKEKSVDYYKLEALKELLEKE